MGMRIRGATRIAEALKEKEVYLRSIDETQLRIAGTMNTGAKNTGSFREFMELKCGR